MNGCFTSSRMFLSALVWAVSLAFRTIMACDGGHNSQSFLLLSRDTSGLTETTVKVTTASLGRRSHPYLLQNLHGKYLAGSGSHHFPNLKNLQGRNRDLNHGLKRFATLLGARWTHITFPYPPLPRTRSSSKHSGRMPSVPWLTLSSDISIFSQSSMLLQRRGGILSFITKSEEDAFTEERASYSQLKATALIHDVIQLSLKINQTGSISESHKPTSACGLDLGRCPGNAVTLTTG